MVVAGGVRPADMRGACSSWRYPVALFCCPSVGGDLAALARGEIKLYSLDVSDASATQHYSFRCICLHDGDFRKAGSAGGRVPGHVGGASPQATVPRHSYE